MKFVFTPNTAEYARTSGDPSGKLSDCELYFEEGDGPLVGLRLIGFAVWQRKNGVRTVTFPARQYVVNGERRAFALLRPLSTGSIEAQDRLRDVILEAYREFEDLPRAPSEPHVVGTDAPTPENDPAGRFRQKAKAR